MVKHLSQLVNHGTQAVNLPFASVLSDSAESYSFIGMGTGRLYPW